MDDEEREHQRKPIRLRVSYRSAQALVTEYTTSISRGGCAIESHRSLEPGTRFDFELYAPGDAIALKVEGRVVRSEPIEDGLHRVAIEYLPTGSERAALDQAIDTLFKEHQFEKERQHPRVPVNLVAVDGREGKAPYLLRDLSLGGVGLQLPKDRSLPPYIDVRTPVSLEITMGDDADRCAVEGQVVWVLKGRPSFSNPRLGAVFSALSERQKAILDQLLRLNRPKQILVTFGD